MAEAGLPALGNRAAVQRAAGKRRSWHCGATVVLSTAGGSRRPWPNHRRADGPLRAGGPRIGGPGGAGRLGRCGLGSRVDFPPGDGQLHRVRVAGLRFFVDSRPGALPGGLADTGRFHGLSWSVDWAPLGGRVRHCPARSAGTDVRGGVEHTASAVRLSSRAGGRQRPVRRRGGGGGGRSDRARRAWLGGGPPCHADAPRLAAVHGLADWRSRL